MNNPIVQEGLCTEPKVQTLIRNSILQYCLRQPTNRNVQEEIDDYMTLEKKFSFLCGATDFTRTRLRVWKTKKNMLKIWTNRTFCEMTQNQTKESKGTKEYKSKYMRESVNT